MDPKFSDTEPYVLPMDPDIVIPEGKDIGLIFWDWIMDDPHHMDRKVVPTANEVITLAESLWKDPRIKKIINRVQYDQDTTKEEDIIIYKSVGAYRHEFLWDRDFLNLMLSIPMLRQLSAQKIEKLRCDETYGFYDINKTPPDPVVNGFGGGYPRETLLSAEDAFLLMKFYAKCISVSELLTKVEKFGQDNVDGDYVRKNNKTRKFEEERFRQIFGFYNRNLDYKIYFVIKDFWDSKNLRFNIGEFSDQIKGLIESRISTRS